MGAESVHPNGEEALVRSLRRQASAAAQITEGEGRRLLARAAAGDRTSQERLVAANLGTVLRLARLRSDRGLSVADLVQEGSLGLVEAVRSFPAGGDASYETFTGFAERRVVDQMDAALAAEAAAVRDAELLVAAATDYERTELLLRRQLQREATEAEIAQKLEWSVERTQYVAQVVAEARRRYDVEMLAFIDPAAVDVDDVTEG